MLDRLLCDNLIVSEVVLSVSVKMKYVAFVEGDYEIT